MSRQFAAVIMAAGKSTRMKSALPKGAHAICGKSMTRHVVDACMGAGIGNIVVVVGYEAEKMKAAVGPDVTYAMQAEQLGTGDACLRALPSISADVTDVVVLPGDAPLITSQALVGLIETHAAKGNAATLLTAILDDGGSYGRVIRDDSGAVTEIIEAKDAYENVLAIQEINASIYCFDKAALIERLGMLRTDNAQGEYYLTDVIKMLADAGRLVGAVAARDATDVKGINNRIELAQGSARMRSRILNELMLTGVTIVDPATTYIDSGVVIGADTVIYPCTVIERGSRIGANCEVGPFARMRGVTLADGTKE